MNKMLATVIASTFVFAAGAGIAADATKKEELTAEQRVEMRARAERLSKERAQATAPVKTDAAPAPKTTTTR